MAKTLEIDIFGMRKLAEDRHCLAENRDSVEYWDVSLAERDDETGEITSIEEHEELTQEKAWEVTQDILKRYPNAEENDPYPN
ncbi:MAG: hypothetical protein NXH70_02215 [Hyphomonas sp.]|nr:hypothetical protein [Hyphomonas sp.]